MSEIKLKLEAALKTAMKSGDELSKRTLRLAVASIKNAEIEKREPLDDTSVINILQKEIKMRRESIEGAKSANRTELITQYEAEIRVLEDLLPRQLSEDELKKVISSVITELGVSGPAAMGQVMKLVLPKVQGQAANNEVSRLVKELLSS